MADQFNRQINLLPDKANENIKKIISILGLELEPFYIQIIPEKDAEYGDCFNNVLKKVIRDRGEIIYGWQFCEYDYMIEAEFHAIWKSPAGEFIDITFSADPVMTRSLFVVDQIRKFERKQIDNVRLNTTTSELIDDIIDIEKAKYRFMNKADRIHRLGELQLNIQDQALWNEMNLYSEILEDMFYTNLTIHTKCFCNSGENYKQCHRIIIKQFILHI